ncbi:hypothetical protein EG328_002088 [Venturia inaequalis]|uniref:Glutathione hydrolase n=1 Tax=Venturia inaequalis TaxID=5025 RepID=A0A8H3UVG2_VENIN|nr:hypothetical protein EG328_002088 [Venturia inaequalis]
MWGLSYWVFPLFAALVWLAMLLGMLLTWITNGKPHLASMDDTQNIAYISDVGATNLKPLFIAMSAVTVVVFDFSFIVERYLRHSGRLAPNTSTWQKVLSVLSIIFSICGAVGLILLTIFDTLRHHNLHDGFLILFIAGYVLTAICCCWEYQRLGIHYRQHRILRISFWVKLAFGIIEVGLAIGFGVENQRKRYNTAAILEWVIAFVYTFFVFSFFLDFIPAVRTKHHQSRETEDQMAMNESAVAPGPAMPVTLIQLALGSPLHSFSEPRLGAVASESATCSKIGTSILLKGGNAADALVATNICVGVLGMYHSGIGGGGFATIRAPNGSYFDLDFRETAPASAFEDMYKNDELASFWGGLSCGVPGELRGLEWIHGSFGVLSWREVLTPGIELARKGWAIERDLSDAMDSLSEGGFLHEEEEWSRDFAPNGTRLGLGDWITRKRYADTLEKIANEGVDVFYTGKMAEDLVKAVNAKNGSMTVEDLRDYKIQLRKPASLDYRGYKLTSNSAPASGVLSLAVMNTMEGYEDFGWNEKLNLSTHRLDEATRWAYGMRMKLGDPSFVDEDLSKYQQNMLAPSTGREVRANISDTKAYLQDHYNPDGWATLDNHGTSQISVADASGLAISLTTTINLFFGSKVMVPETGIIMNDEMNDFSIPGRKNAFGYEPHPANFIRPGKRPLSSISPTIVEHANGSLYFVIGSAGGSRIPSAVIQQLWFVLDRNMSLSESLEQPRFHDQLQPDSMALEWPQDENEGGGWLAETGRLRFGYDNATAAYLKDLGHNITWMAPHTSSVQGVRIIGNGTFEAAGEPRQLTSGGFAV